VQGYIVRRVLAAFPLIIIVAIFTFGLLYLTPGDPAVFLAGEEGTTAEIEEVRHRLGLDRPFHIRLGKWLGSLARGDLGKSILNEFPVSTLIKQRVEASLSLAILSTLMAVGIAVPLGVLAAWKANSWIDRSVMVFSSLGFAVPGFFLGFILMWIFGIRWHLLPPAGYVPIGEDFEQYIRRLVLPGIATALTFMALITRMTRASMMEVLKEDYIRTARAKGLGEKIVLFRHALRNASLPVLTVIGLGTALLLSGLVVTETVFNVPGLGRLVFDAIRTRDYPVIQGMVIVTASVYIFVNLAVDLMYGYLDPRIRY
jgi:peptide/nickel transport system permease protein